MGQSLAHNFRNEFNRDEKDRRRKMNKAKKGSDRKKELSRGFNGATVVVADDYKDYHKRVLEVLFAIYDPVSNELTEDNYKGYLLKNIGAGDDKKRDEPAGGGNQ